ncbi:DUF4913 domain-containing protein [Micromonospora fiedleri]|uniref:DUF4913 domain-containing protein n=1 Tax=Micromonospora fiedleri TaxID=1157498 RepID=A0ABS1UTH4_9ACTN|nr:MULTISPECIES: DUF4913 domain-containing protein [Micromonospora]MBL6279637.1 DUF4913 domain-containing protein [Micromonospora fiedleri]WSK40155.1 DUF4913 domain-containing protein [Micromonospora maris]
MTQVGPGVEETDEEGKPFFILYLDAAEYEEELRRLSYWVENLLLPVYGGEVSSSSPWCPRWWEHPEAIAYLHGLWLAWQERTGPQASGSDPATWHQSHLWPTMDALRSPNGPFAGCKPGSHRPKERPQVDSDAPHSW